MLKNYVGRIKIYTPYLACFSASLFSFYNLFQLTLFNTISADLLKAFKLNSTQLGIFSSTYLLANTLWLIPAGMIIDNYSPRRLVLLFITIDIVACFTMAQSNSLIIDTIMRFLQGMASAMSLLTTTRFAIKCFPKNSATAVGCMIAFALSGGMFANYFSANIIKWWHWRIALQIDGLIGIGFLLIMLFFLPENNNRNVLIQGPITYREVKLSLLNLKNIAYGIYIGLMNLPIFILATLWGTLYLTQAKNIEFTTAGHICALLFLGLITGSPLAGFIADRLQNKNRLMLYGPVLSLICTLPLILPLYLNIHILASVFFILGFFSSTQILAFPAIAKINPKLILSTATSIATFFSNMIGTVAQPLFGFILNFRAYPVYSKNLPYYSSIVYIKALFIFPIAFILSAIIVWFCTNSLAPSLTHN